MMIRIARGLLKFISILVVVVLIMNCGKPDNSQGDDNDINKNINRAQKTSPSQKGGVASPVLKLPASETSWFKKISFDPESLKAGAPLKLDVETIVPEDKEYSLSYVFFLNGKKMEEQKENILSRSLVKKKDMIFVDALLYIDNRLIEQKRSEMVFLANAPPVIHSIDVPKIPGPGTYTITVKAEDTDGDTLTYSLLPESERDNVPGALKIDPGSGMITLTLGASAPPENMKFIVAVDDGDGGVSKMNVSIPFSITKETRKEKIEEKKSQE